ncbi:hypothetical protein BT96DRAFT_944955 [Gymnopus androsaceus JB14]|uniref:Uncharacterized protein n=1 Tax=Gymnopus androsaceus JB14 TaxID=1447944 RepID=A0A6A4H2V4_9AGAR|nr:hypothetical protein BT96DRAFT_944955 [Gymnopus androsaceus JB14]
MIERPPCFFFNHRDDLANLATRPPFCAQTLPIPCYFLNNFTVANAQQDFVESGLKGASWGFGLAFNLLAVHSPAQMQDGCVSSESHSRTNVTAVKSLPFYWPQTQQFLLYIHLCLLNSLSLYETNADTSVSQCYRCICNMERSFTNKNAFTDYARSACTDFRWQGWSTLCGTQLTIWRVLDTAAIQHAALSHFGSDDPAATDSSYKLSDTNLYGSPVALSSATPPLPLDSKSKNKAVSQAHNFDAQPTSVSSLNITPRTDMVQHELSGLQLVPERGADGAGIGLVCDNFRCVVPLPPRVVSLPETPTPSSSPWSHDALTT